MSDTPIEIEKNIDSPDTVDEVIIQEEGTEERPHMNFNKLPDAAQSNAITFAKPEDVEDVECEDIVLADITPEHIDLTKRMLKLLAEINGLGLAAPQIGIKKKFFVYWDSRDNVPHCCYNAKYYIGQGKAVWGERCLTYGQLVFAIKRYKSVQAVWWEYDADKHELVKRTKRLRGLEAEIFQHETDHMYGETIATKGKLIIRK